MNLVMLPCAPLRGEVSLPGDKSIAHRAVLLAAVAEGMSRIDNFQAAGVTRAALRLLSALGVHWELRGDSLAIEGRGRYGLRPPGAAVDCGNSATTLRLAAGLLAGANVPAVLDGSAGLRRRPMAPLVTTLAQLGASLQASDGGRAPVSVRRLAAAQVLHAGQVSIPSASAQLKSASLLAALGADGPVEVVEPEPTRDHTERMLTHMGVTLERAADPRRIRLLPPRGPLPPLSLRLPGDFSSAAFLIAAALITPGSLISLHNVGLNPTRTGMLEVLERMGARLQVQVTGQWAGEPVGDIRVEHSDLRATDVEGDRVVRMIDEFPVFAVLAAYARGEARVRNASALRDKESDRIATLCGELRILGAQVVEYPDGFAIRGGDRLHGGRVRAHGDHRLGMALAVAGSAAAAPVTVEQAEVIGESFPAFVETLQSLGASLA